MFKKRGLFKKTKKSSSEVGSLASGKSSSGYEVSPKKDLGKLHKAAFEGNLTKLKALLKKEDINLLDKQNRTPLHLACANGKIDAVRMLVNYPNCNLNLCDNDRRSALMKCVQCQFQTCMDILLQKGADLSLSDVNGNTALHLAVSIPSIDLSDRLLDYSADVHSKNKDGSTPLHIAASIDGSVEVIKVLLDEGAQINSTDNKGKTPLMLSASRGHLDIVKYFLSKGADPLLRDKQGGWTADDYASMSGHHPISHIIVEHSMKNKPAQPTTAGSSQNLPEESHIYSSIKRNNFGAPKPMVDMDSSIEEDTQSNRSDPNKSSDSSDTEPTPQKPDAAKPKVNLMHFLTQREKLKQQSMESNEEKSPDKTKTPIVESRIKHNDDSTDSENEHQNLIAQRGYTSRSQKKGPVSPAKPPLPKPKVVEVVDDDSPWDSEEESGEKKEEKEKEEKGKGEEENISPRSKIHTKPNSNLMASLGFSEDDVKDIYGNDSDTSFDSSKVDHVKTDHGSWDADHDSDDIPPVNNNITARFLADSSDFKFDDELSDDSVEAHLAPTSPAHPTHAPAAPTPASRIMKENKEEPREDSSSWDSDEAEGQVAPPSNPNPHSPYKVDKMMTSAKIEDNQDDDVSDFDTESVSSWEVEAKNKKKQAGDRVGGVGEESENERERKKEEKRTLKTLAQEASDKHRKLQEEKEKREKEEKIKRENEEKVQREKEQKMRKAREEKLRREEEEKVKKEREEKLKKEKREKEEQRKKEEKKKKEEKVKLEKEEREKLESIKMEEERIANEEKIRRRQFDDAQNRSQDREKLHSALHDALNDAASASDSESSALDDSFMGNTAGNWKSKMGDIRTSMTDGDPNQDLIYDPILDGGKNGGMMRLDLDNLTATETETEDEVPGEIPASLKSSQLSESLKRSGEHGELVREVAKEKRRANDAFDRLEFYKKESKELKEQIKEYKRERDSWEKTGSERETSNRKLNFELTQSKERLESLQLDLALERDHVKRLNEQLEIEGGTRRQQEVNLRDLRGELKNSEQAVKQLEGERNELLEQIKTEKQKQTIRMKVDEGKSKQDATDDTLQDRRIETLKLLVAEKDQELSSIKADRDALDDSCKRYKEELANWRSTDTQFNKLGVLNEQLNDRVDELTRENREQEELLEQAAMRFNLRIEHLTQANNTLTAEIQKERNEKENSRRDLELLNEQQRALKRTIEDLTSTNRKADDQVTRLRDEIADARLKWEQSETKHKASEIACTLAQQEANNVRTTLTHKETLLAQNEREREEVKEQLRRSESEKSEMHRENARLEGRVGVLQAEVSQQESDRMRLRRELEDARNIGLSNLNTQQGKLSDIVSEHHTERLELEKQNVKLKQQVAHLSDEIQRISEEKAHKEKVLGQAQQDFIDTEKKLHFADSLLKQHAESQRKLQDEKDRTQTELQLLKAQADSMSHRVEELSKLSSDLRTELDHEKMASANLNREVQSAQAVRSHDKDNVTRLEGLLREVELKNVRLQSDVDNLTRREQEMREEQDLLGKSRMQMEQLIGRLQEEKTDAERRLGKEEERYRILQAEADGHRQMWETEVKTRSKLSVDLASLQNEKRDAMSRVESSHRKLTRASEVGRAYKSKYEQQKRRRVQLEHQIESMSDSSISDVDRSRGDLKIEMMKLRRSLEQNGRSPDLSHDVVNAQISEKLDEVNNFLETESARRDIIEKMRMENEESRLMDAKMRIAALERQVDTLRRSQGSEEPDLTARLQGKVRENISLQENLRRTKQDLEEERVKSENERRRYQSLYASTHVNSSTIPHVSAFNGGLQNGRSQPWGFTSTPRKDLNEPYLTQLRNKLDVSITQRLAEGRPHSASPILDGTGLNRSSNEYFVP